MLPVLNVSFVMHMVGINSICTFVDNVYNVNIICTRVFFHPSFGYIRSFLLLKSKCENPVPPMTCDFLMFRLMILFASCFKWVKPKGRGYIPKIGGHNLDFKKLQRIEASFILFIPRICTMEISNSLTILERRKRALGC